VTVPVSVQDGTLNLQFASSINNAKVSAIRVVPASGGTPAGVTVTQTGTSTAVTEGGATDTFTVALTEILGVQSGGALDVSGINWSGATSLVTETKEGHGIGEPEIALWKAYDANVALADQGTLDPPAGTNAGTSAYNFLVDPPIGFTRFDLTAAPYPNTAGSTGDYSEFSLQRVAHTSHDFVL
jgi:hypothetical protein